ncbi:hypothetical protein ADJ73_10595 [Arsenicicoccus sp. oral taxon 190]|nr:hypothetical protein ADJ73_10595 [Arsenicicoccus sp. oral taxon 190]
MRTARRPGSAGLLTRVRSLPRLARAVGNGEYHGTSMGSLVALAAAVAYVVSPVDLLPEGVLSVFGLGDDTLVLAWAAAHLVTVTEDFLGWERSGGRAAPGDPATVTVPSHVVR